MGQVISDAATVLRALDGWLEHYNAVHPHKVQGYRWPRELRKADGGGRDGQCDRRSVSTGGSTLCTGGDRVKSEAAAARRCKSSGLTRASCGPPMKVQTVSGYSGATTVRGEPHRKADEIRFVEKQGKDRLDTLERAM